MLSLPGHAAEHGLSWKVYAGSSGYPVNFYTQLRGSANIVASDEVVTDAKNQTLPELAMVWHDSPYDEDPVADVTQGQDNQDAELPPRPGLPRGAAVRIQQISLVQNGIGNRPRGRERILRGVTSIGRSGAMP